MRNQEINSERGREIAGQILSQLGGSRFMAMTGTKPKYFDGYSSMYKLTRNKVGAQYMKITLNVMGTYDMEFIKLNSRTGEKKIVAEKSWIYNDQLQDIFTAVTGLYTSLGTMGS